MKNKEYFIKLLRKIISNNNLSENEAFSALKILLNHELGDANDTCFGAFLASLMTKGAVVDEVLGLIKCVLNYDRIELKIERHFHEPLCGIIGSGKDDFKTFNVSSISAIVAAAAGVKVLKNGSRSEASVAGTTDVFEYLGVNVLDNRKEKLEKCLDELNFAFCDVKPYFPRMNKEYMGKFFFVHPLSYVLPIASGISFDRVVFGLANDNTEFTANLLIKLGYNNSMVVAGHDLQGNNFDEISNIGKTKISEIKDGKITTYEIMPEDWGIPLSSSSEIREGNSIQENAIIFQEILNASGCNDKVNIILMNAGALIYISGMCSSIQEGIALAKDTILSGKAKSQFNKIKELLI